MIFERADADKPFMGLTTFSGDMPTRKDVVVAKNYLNEDELKVLNNLVSGYFDFAEIQAIKHSPMHMSDYVEHLDRILSTTGEKLLDGSGTISHKQTEEKALEEYRKYQCNTLSQVEKDYLNTINNLGTLAKKQNGLKG